MILPASDRTVNTVPICLRGNGQIIWLPAWEGMVNSVRTCLKENGEDCTHLPQREWWTLYPPASEGMVNTATISFRGNVEKCTPLPQRELWTLHSPTSEGIMNIAPTCLWGNGENTLPTASEGTVNTTHCLRGNDEDYTYLPQMEWWTRRRWPGPEPTPAAARSTQAGKDVVGAWPRTRHRRCQCHPAFRPPPMPEWPRAPIPRWPQTSADLWSI